MKLTTWKGFRRLACILLSAILTASVLTACGGGDGGDKSGGAGNVINVAFTTAWGGFDPYYTASDTMYEMAVYDKLFDKLVFTDMAGADILPRAAESWESVDDGKAIVFHLNSGATWSDGEKATAHDWVFTLQLLADPTCAFSTRVFTRDLAGTDEDGVSISGEPLGAEAVDDYTLKLTFKEITPPEDFLLNYNRRFLVLPEHLLKEEDPAQILTSDFWKNPVGSGPCIFVSQVMGSEITLKPNPNYQLGNGNWDTLVLRTVDSANTLTALMSHEVDMRELGSGITSSEKPLAEANGLTVREAEIRNFFLEVLINERTIHDARIRQALHYAIDKDVIVNASAPEVGVPAFGYEMQNTSYGDPSLEFHQDVEKAKALLQEAGYDGKPFTIAFSSKRENVAALLVQQWEAAGIHVNMMIVDVATMFSGLSEGIYDLGISGHSASAYPLWFEGEFPANDNPTPDPVRDDYVQRIRTTADMEEKIPLVKEYQQYLAEQTYFIPLYFSGDYWVESPRVSGIRNAASLMCNDNVWEWNLR